MWSRVKEVGCIPNGEGRERVSSFAEIVLHEKGIAGLYNDTYARNH
jgi:hypothetical protein